VPNFIESLHPLTIAVLMVMIKWRLCISVCSAFVLKKTQMQLILSVMGVEVGVGFGGGGGIVIKFCF
jgi:hypothetical protein